MKDFTSIQDFEDHASNTLSLSVKSYFFGGAGSQKTIQLNREAFDKLRIRPKCLRNVSRREISTTVLGQKVSMPLGVSPTGRQKWAHLDGECANARAAESAETVFIHSTYSNSTIQEVAKAAPKAIKWQQLAIHKDRACTLHIVRRAEQAGFKAIVVTIDNPVLPKSKSNRIVTNDSTILRVYEDYFLTKYSKEELGDVFGRVKTIINDSLTWEDISWLKSITKLPIVVKGILRAEDAVLAVDHGASAILVSNHGGRQLDSVPATLETLPEIVRAVENKVEIYLDGGIRRGIDVFKALALGAKMVFVGRAMLWGLVCGGEEGAKAILDIFHSEIDETFALTGCLNVKEVTKDLVSHESLYSRL